MKFAVAILLALLARFPGYALDREAFAFTNYDLDLRIEPEQQRLGVRGKIVVRNDSGVPQKNLVLQISSTLDWRSIRADNKPVQFVSQPYASDIDHSGSLSEAVISLPNPVPPKGTVELQIGYEGLVPLDATRLTRIGAPEDEAGHGDWDQISKAFTAIRGIGYVAWYPIATESASLSEPDSVFDTLDQWSNRELSSRMELNICVDRETNPGVSLLANGDTSGQSEATDTSICRKFGYSELGSTTPTFTVGNYSVLDRPNVVINYFEAQKSGAEDYALAVELAASFVSEWFGTFREKARLIEIVDPQAAPFETDNVLFTSLAGLSDSRLAQMTAVHQLTHCAFPSSRRWVQEGLAAFAQAVYREQQGGRQAALDFMDLHRPGLIATEHALSTADAKQSAAQSLINTAIPDLYRSKAMYVWWMLRDMLQEQPLKKALAQYRPEQDRSPSYMQNLIAGQAQRDLEWFFDDWVYRDRGLPDFRVESAFPRKLLDAGYVVTITIENLGSAGAEVPVTLKVEGGQITKRVLVMGKAKASIRMEASGTPQQVTVNDGSVPESDLSNNSFTIAAPSH